jgi:gliding motility-associated-like protein
VCILTKLRNFLMKTFCRISAIAFSIFLFAISLNAQQGIHGARTVTAANTVVNEYTPLTANAAANSTIISVTNSTLNGNGRFTANLAPGDLIMIIQIQGVAIIGTLNGTVASPIDTSWGQITSYNSCGLFEYAQVKSVPNATSIELDCGLRNAYLSGGTNRAQVVRVPRWTTLTVNAGAGISADDWNGTVGGIAAVEVQGNAVINGTIDVSGRGFRGGALLENVTTFGVNNVGSTDPTFGAEKGEGIVGYQADYDPLGGRYGRGAAANGGGGGCAHNSGGGGGANGGNTGNWRGMGVPDPNAAYTSAWNVDPQYGINYITTLTTANSSGGGRGGYSFSDQNANAGTLGPGVGGWGGDSRNWGSCGLGGRPLNYSTGRLFLGGGGGAGDMNQNQGGVGGDGGGLIYIMCYGNVSGAGTVVSNGNNGANSFGTAPTTSYAGRDGSGGGGAGGTIVINSVGTLTGISATANGGNGGNQVMTRGAFFFGAINEAEGPGGGGGGGHIAISTGAITRTANGGLNGTTNSDALTEFLPNGAMRGGSGNTTATVTNFTITATGATICAGQTATLTATVNGTPPSPQSVLWYTAAAGGNPIFTGTSFTTPVLGSTTTYYVGTCPGTYRIPVTVTVNPLPVADAGANTAICTGNSTTITATGGGTYSWNGGALSNTPGASQTVSPVGTTTYTVTVTLNGCTATDQVTVTVNPAPVADAGLNTTICSGNNATITATGGGTYSWNGGALSNTPGASQTVSPVATTTYTVTVTAANGCTATDQVTITVNTSPVAFAGNDIALCTGNDTVLTATGGGTYSWNGGTLINAPGASQTITPAATTTYTVTVTAANGCTDTDEITVSVNSAPIATAGTDQSVCNGATATLTAGGGGTYSWNGGTLVNAAGASQSVSPSTTTDYIVTVSLGNGCEANDTVRITVNPNPVAAAGADISVCSGDTANLIATGGGTYIWNGGVLVNAAGASQNVNPATATTYVVLVTDANNCTDTDTVQVTINALPLVSAGNDASVCASSSTQLGASGAQSYVWSPAAGLSSTTSATPTATPAVTTTYIVTGTDSNGCSAVDSVTVTVTTVLTVSAGNDATICSGDSTILSTSGGVSYSWTPAASLNNAAVASPVATPSSTTTYTVLVTDANGCQGTDSVTVFVNAALTLSVSGAQTICIGQTAIISATPSGGTSPYTYTWSNSLPGNSSNSVSPGTTTTYSVSVTDSLGCSAGQQTITVTVNPPLNLSVTGNTTICSGGTAQITASGLGGDGVYAYNWQPGNVNGAVINVSPSVTTVYTVTLTDGCGTPTQTASVTVTVAPAPTVTITSNTAAGCAPLCVNFNGQTTANCATSAWDFGDGNTSSQSSPANCYNLSGSYTVIYTCTDVNGCVGSDTIVNMITVAPEPVASIAVTPATAVLVLAPGGSQQICFDDNTSGAATWNWNFNSTSSNLENPCFTVNDTGNYCADLIVANAVGCDDTINYCLRVVNEAIFSFPNVFTPNGDGTNDIFSVSGSGIKNVHCYIFDRWGVKVGEWDASNGNWDGRTTSGQLAVDGVYYFTAEVTDFNDKVVETTGFFQLIR